MSTTENDKDIWERNNKVVKAVALKYDGVNSPKLTAKGEGKLAQEIISLAEQSEVHIHYDPLLLNVLSRLELGEEIPETLYLSVAKIIAFAYYLQGKHPDNVNKTNNKNESLITQNSTTKKLNKDQSIFP